MPSLSGLGARPSRDNLRNVSLDTGQNFLICDQRDLPDSGRISGVQNLDTVTPLKLILLKNHRRRIFFGVFGLLVHNNDEPGHILYATNK